MARAAGPDPRTRTSHSSSYSGAEDDDAAANSRDPDARRGDMVEIEVEIDGDAVVERHGDDGDNDDDDDDDLVRPTTIDEDAGATEKASVDDGADDNAAAMAAAATAAMRRRGAVVVISPSLGRGLGGIFLTASSQYCTGGTLAHDFDAIFYSSAFLQLPKFLHSAEERGAAPQKVAPQQLENEQPFWMISHLRGKGDRGGGRRTSNSSRELE